MGPTVGSDEALAKQSVTLYLMLYSSALLTAHITVEALFVQVISLKHYQLAEATYENFVLIVFILVLGRDSIKLKKAMDEMTMSIPS